MLFCMIVNEVLNYPVIERRHCHNLNCCCISQIFLLSLLLLFFFFALYNFFCFDLERQCFLTKLLWRKLSKNEKKKKEKKKKNAKSCSKSYGSEMKMRKTKWKRWLRNEGKGLMWNREIIYNQKDIFFSLCTQSPFN